MPLGLLRKGAEVCETERGGEESRAEERRRATAVLALCLSEVSTKEDQEIRENSILF